MASPILHIKDSYYFEIPKMMWRWNSQTKKDFPDVYVKLDPDFQHWEAHRLVHELEELTGHEPELHHLEEHWSHWQHEGHANHGKPLDVYLEEQLAQVKQEHRSWQKEEGNAEKSLTDFVEQAHPENGWFASHMEKSGWASKWETAKTHAGGRETIEEYKSDTSIIWSKEKITGYNKALDGKILIPQPFGGELRNFYEKESGFCVSKFMIIELVVAILIVGVFTWLATRMRSSNSPKGRVWNFLEAILLFMRDQVARPAIGKKDADRFVPLLWTIFLFILGCNLMGMLPWAGSPTGVLAVTFALACVTFGTVVVSGSRTFGVVGFWMNQVPSMELSFPIALIIKPMLFVIEVMGLLIKHSVLAVRLLANMVAGHLVLLGIMALAFSLEGAMSPAWPFVAPISVIGSTAFSCLELFVAFLQAYVFTLLSALFIGAAIHHH